MIAIEKNVPVPASSRGRRQSKYPWKDMEVGDSFYVPVDGQSKGVIGSVTSGAHYALGRGNYAVRSEGVGVRVWRLK